MRTDLKFCFSDSQAEDTRPGDVHCNEDEQFASYVQQQKQLLIQNLGFNSSNVNLRSEFSQSFTIDRSREVGGQLPTSRSSPYLALQRLVLRPTLFLSIPHDVRTIEHARTVVNRERPNNYPM